MWKSISHGLPPNCSYPPAGALWKNNVAAVKMIRSSNKRYKSRIAYPPGMTAYEEDYSKEPNYPPIDPEIVRYNIYRQERYQKDMNWKNGMMTKATVEEKLMEINLPRRFGWFLSLLTDQKLSYDSWDLMKYVTRTQKMNNTTKLSNKSDIEDQNQVPKLKSPDYHLPMVYYEPELNNKVDYFKEKLKTDLRDIVMFELNSIEREVKESESPREQAERKTSSVVNQVSRYIIQALGSEVEYLRKVQVDRDPKIEAFWMMGGFARTEPRKKMLRNNTGVSKFFCQVKEDDPIERNMQYEGSNIIQLRSHFPLGEFADPEYQFDSEAPHYFNHQPPNYEVRTKLRHATNNAGHWSGCTARSNLLSIHSTNHIFGFGSYREYKIRTEDPHWIARVPALLDTQAILVSFAKLVAQAYTLGFNQFTDLLYPLTSQTILTNGEDWSFYTYQLNTFKFDARNIHKNKKQNMCWGTPPMKIIKSDGSLNLEVVENLLKFYLRPSLVDSSKRFATPYIKENLNDMTDEIKREFIFENFQDMYSQKKMTDGYYHLPEMYQWEKFYKVDHAMMPAEPRRRFFELPNDMAVKPYHQYYKLRDPRRTPSMLVKLRTALELKKEAERIEAAKLVEKSKYSVDKDGDETN